MHDFLIDGIGKEAKVIWDGKILGSEFAFPSGASSGGKKWVLRSGFEIVCLTLKEQAIWNVDEGD